MSHPFQTARDVRNTICGNCNQPLAECRCEERFGMKPDIPQSEDELPRIVPGTPKAEPMTRLQLLERVNRLNTISKGDRYWTVTVLYNTVIWRKRPRCNATMFEVIEGIPK